jgi:hypothetical protein
MNGKRSHIASRTSFQVTVAIETSNHSKVLRLSTMLL